MGIALGRIEAFRRPRQFDAAFLQEGLKAFEHGGIGLNLVDAAAAAQTMCGQKTRDFADVPLHGMQPIATIGEVGGADILTGR